MLEMFPELRRYMNISRRQIATILDYNIVKVSWETAPVDKDPISPLGEEDLYGCNLSKDPFACYKTRQVMV